MTVLTYEAAAMLAAYSAEITNLELYDMAGKLAMGAVTDATAALEDAYAATERHPRLSLEAWLDRPDAGEQIAHRVALQENFTAYRGIARRAFSPILSPLTVMPFHRPHLGSQAIAFEIENTAGRPAILKAPHGYHMDEGKWRRPEPLDRARFTESVIRNLPSVPTVNFEQILAASYAGRVITSAIPGRPLYKLVESDLKQITDAHLLAAIGDLTRLAQAGVLHDGNGGNTKFDPNPGFGFFDPLSVNRSSEGAIRYRLIMNIQDFVRNLTGVKGVMSKRARTPAAGVLRRELFDRIKVLVPQLPEEARSIVEELDYNPDSTSY